MTGYICMALFRADRLLLRQQLKSIRFQTLTEWRCVIGIDGEDTDLRRFVRMQTSGDPRFEIVGFAAHVGFYRNFERVLAEVPSTAEWVALADQDDKWWPEKLEMLVPHLGQAALVVGAARLVDRLGESVAGGVTARTPVDLFGLLIDNRVTGSLAVLRPAVLDRALPFPEPTDASYHDHWLAVCAQIDGGINYVGAVVQDYVQHEANVLGEQVGARIVARTRHLRSRVGGLMPTAIGSYLARQRWGWRVVMARTAIDRQPSLAVEDHMVLAAVARGNISVQIIERMVRAVFFRTAPLGRTVALMVGALFWPMSERAGYRGK
ncbi:glycosyltransferase [Pengzhenrongella sp.]|jgi:hypothetical protein|uniref:glycosyltransferase n=1 Tax=Pengzhenrongella sp. TaxID=2888820 RepID=UPI002F9289D5